MSVRLHEARRLVVKLGSSCVADGQGRPRMALLQALGQEMAALMDGPPRRQMLLVSSGAIALGWPLLGFKRRPMPMPEKQAAAAAGQAALMEVYRSVFQPLGRPVAQVLLTADDVRHRVRFVHAYRTFEALLAKGALVVVNENDTVAVDEIRVGDNDTLSAMVAVLVEADLLVILSDVDGVYSADPRKSPGAARFSVVERVDDLMSGATSLTGVGPLGTGGMRTKIEAARLATGAGIPVVVTRARPGVLEEILSGRVDGTLFVPSGRVLRGKKRWLAFYASWQGTLAVDDGARRALVLEGRSLLSAGVVRVDGRFESGSVVRLVDLQGLEFGRGVVAFDSEAIRLAVGRAERPGLEVVHRDDLVITASPEAKGA